MGACGRWGCGALWGGGGPVLAPPPLPAVVLGPAATPALPTGSSKGLLTLILSLPTPPPPLPPVALLPPAMPPPGAVGVWLLETSLA